MERPNRHIASGHDTAELLDFFRAASDRDREAVMAVVHERLGIVGEVNEPQQRRVRILTMHGAKGLSGKVVFILSLEQGILPSARALQAAGLVIEQRRLFYVSLTRPSQRALFRMRTCTRVLKRSL